MAPLHDTQALQPAQQHALPQAVEATGPPAAMDPHSQQSNTQLLAALKRLGLIFNLNYFKNPCDNPSQSFWHTCFG